MTRANHRPPSRGRAWACEVAAGETGQFVLRPLHLTTPGVGCTVEDELAVCGSEEVRDRNLTRTDARDFQVIGVDNPKAAAAIEAKPHPRSGQPKRHARKLKPSVDPVDRGEKGDSNVELVKDQLHQEETHPQPLDAALTYLPKLSQAQHEVLLQRLEPLDRAVKDIRTKPSWRKL